MARSDDRVEGLRVSHVSLGRHLLWQQKAVVWSIALLVMVWWAIVSTSAGIVSTSEQIGPIIAIPRLVRHESAMPAPFMVPLPDTSVTC